MNDENFKVYINSDGFARTVQSLNYDYLQTILAAIEAEIAVRKALELRSKLTNMVKDVPSDKLDILERCLENIIPEPSF